MIRVCVRVDKDDGERAVSRVVQFLKVGFDSFEIYNYKVRYLGKVNEDVSLRTRSFHDPDRFSR